MIVGPDPLFESSRRTIKSMELQEDVNMPLASCTSSLDSGFQAYVIPPRQETPL
jgi:hypothetical protein